MNSVSTVWIALPDAPVSRHLLAQLAMAILLANEGHQGFVEQRRVGVRLSSQRPQDEEPEDAAGDAAPVALHHHGADLQPWAARAAIQALGVILRATACANRSFMFRKFYNV